VTASNLNSTLNQQVPVTVQNELLVKIKVTAGTGLHRLERTASLDVSVTFLPALRLPRFGNYGPRCGPLLVGSDTLVGWSHQLRFEAQQAPAGAPVLFDLGTTRSAIPIPGSSCLLLTPPVATLSTTANRSGNASMLLSVPGPLQRVVLDVQALVLFTAPGVQASNGVEVVFVD